MHKVVAVALVLIIFTTLPLIHASSNTNTNLHAELYTERHSYLNNETVSVRYYVFVANGRIAAGGSGTWYLNYSSNDTPVANGSVSNAHGYFSIDLARLNISAGGGLLFKLSLHYMYENNTANSYTTFYIVDPASYWFNLDVEPVAEGYYPGTYAKIEISGAVGNLKINYIHITTPMLFWRNITNLALDKDGKASYTFKIPENWAPDTHVSVVVSILNAVETNNFTVSKNYGFYMKLQDSHSSFLSGDRVLISVVHTQSIYEPYFHFKVLSGTNNKVLFTFYTEHNYTQYIIPNNYTGALTFLCDIFNGTHKVESLMVTGHVNFASMYLYFDKSSYHGRDSFHAILDFESNVMRAPEFEYIVYAMYSGVFSPLYYITTTKREIQINTPSSPPEAYMVRVMAVYDGYQQSTYSEIELASNVQIYATLISRSSYTTGVFTPGDNIEIKYSIEGNVKDGIMYYGLGDSFYRNPEKMMFNGSKAGVLKIQIPENITNGISIFHIKVVYKGGEIDKKLMINIDTNPPWSQYIIFTMPAGDFVTLIIVVSVVVSAVIYVRAAPSGTEDSSASKKNKGRKDKTNTEAKEIDKKDESEDSESADKPL